MTEAATRSGHIRVARRDGDLWLGDDSLGAAIVEILKSHFIDPARDDATGDRHAILVSGQRYLAHLVRLAMTPDWFERLVELVDLAPLEVPETVAGSTGVEDDVKIASTRDSNTSILPTSIPCVSLEDSVRSEFTLESLIVDSTAPGITPRQLAKLRWSKKPIVIFVESNPKWEAALSSVKIENLKILRPMDLAAAKAVVNFQFWTGHSIDLASIRESLDEYCQW